MDLDNAFFTNIYTAISNILITLDPRSMDILLETEEEIKSFIYFIDLLPRPIFNRITIKFDLLDQDFVETIKELVESEKVTLNDVSSNIQSYLLWNASRPL